MENNNSFIKTNSELRRDAREQLKGNWGIAIGLCVIYSIAGGALGQIPYVGYILSLLIAGPLMLGLVSCFMHLVRHEPFIIEDLFNGFKKFLPPLCLLLLMYLFIVLWSLLLIIPGIIASLSYSMSFYILNDNPEMSAMEVLRASKEMMDGYKLKLFGMQLAFLGFFILGIFTLCIGWLWLYPYSYASLANFYENIKGNQKTL